MANYRLLNPFPNKPSVSRVDSTSLLKTLWEKERLLLMSKFFFFLCFLPFWKTFYHFSQIQNCHQQTLPVCLSIGKGVKINGDLYLGQERKHCGKRRKCWLPAFSPFPTMFSKKLSPKGHQKSSSYSKGLQRLWGGGGMSKNKHEPDSENRGIDAPA